MSNNANNANTTSNVATQWKLLMTGMILILIFGLILCVNFLRQQQQNANNGIQSNKYKSFKQFITFTTFSYFSPFHSRISKSYLQK